MILHIMFKNYSGHSFISTKVNNTYLLK